MMIRKPTEWVPPLSELFVDALIECFLAWSSARAVAVLNPWALLGVAKALILGYRAYVIWVATPANLKGFFIGFVLPALDIHRLEPSVITYLV